MRPCCPAVVLLLALLAEARCQQAVPPAAGETFTFAWRAPRSAVVTKLGEKNGQTARLRFRLDVAAEKDGAVRVRMSDFEFLELNGRDATAPEMRAQLAPAIAMAQAVPDILVDREGRYLRIDGIEAMLERFTELEGEQPGRSKAEAEQMRRRLSTPQMQELMQQACAADWQSWAGGWVGWDATPGHDVAATVEMPILGATLPAKVTRRHLGAVAEHPGHVRLSAVMSTIEPEGTSALSAMMQCIAKETGSEPFPSELLESMRAETAFEVITDPRTLLPLRAIRNKTIRVVVKGEKPREQVERNDYTFEWK